MTSEFINQLLTPLILAIFAVGFGLIWYNYRQFRSAGLFSLSYLSGALAFLFEVLIFGDHGLDILAWTGDLFYIASAVLLTLAFFELCRKPAPNRWILGAGIILVLAVSWYRFVDPQVEMRSQMISYATGLYLLLSTSAFYALDKHPIDITLRWLLGAFGILLIVTTFSVLQLGGEDLTQVSFAGSVFLATINFLVSALALSIAVTLFVRYGMELINAFQRRSNTDELTHLLNRRGFEEMAEILRCEAKTTGNDLSMIVCDLDHFKAINDKYGHADGDRALKAFAEYLTQNVRQSDLVGRIGGEEFCLLLPRADRQAAAKISENLRRELSVVALPDLNKNLRLSASFGVAQYREGDTYQNLFKRADAALYRAKQNGRNAVELDNTAPLRPDGKSLTSPAST